MNPLLEILFHKHILFFFFFIVVIFVFSGSPTEPIRRPDLSSIPPSINQETNQQHSFHKSCPIFTPNPSTWNRLIHHWSGFNQLKFNSKGQNQRLGTKQNPVQKGDRITNIRPRVFFFVFLGLSLKPPTNEKSKRNQDTGTCQIRLPKGSN